MTKPVEKRIWTRDFTILTGINFFVGLNLYMLMVIISVYAMERFSASPAGAGFASGIFVFGALAARIFAGRWLERVGRKRMLYAGLAFSFVMTILYFATVSMPILCIVRFFHGAAFGASTTAAGAIVVNVIPGKRRGEGLGYYMMAVTLSTAVGPFLAMLLRRHGNYTATFATALMAALSALLIALFLHISEIQLTDEQKAEMNGFRISSFLETRAIPISIFCATIFFCYSSVLTFLAAFAQEADLLDAAGYFFVVYAMAVLASRPLVGRQFDLRGENPIMYPSIVIFAGGMILLSQAHQGLALLLSGILIGLGSGAVLTVCQAVSVNVTPGHRMGLATSTFFLMIDIAYSIGPFLFGWFIVQAGYRNVYLGGGMTALAGLLLYYSLHGKNAAKRHRFTGWETPDRNRDR